MQGMILDSKEFYAPIITPYEAQLAFSPEGASLDASFRLDFESLLGTQQKVRTFAGSEHGLQKNTLACPPHAAHKLTAFCSLRLRLTGGLATFGWCCLHLMDW